MFVYSSTTQIAPCPVSPENSDLYRWHPGVVNVYSKQHSSGLKGARRNSPESKDSASPSKLAALLGLPRSFSHFTIVPTMILTTCGSGNPLSARSIVTSPDSAGPSGIETSNSTACSDSEPTSLPTTDASCSSPDSACAVAFAAAVACACCAMLPSPTVTAPACDMSPPAATIASAVAVALRFLLSASKV